ncbi:MAG: F0F1 ATP synthase subunit A [Candidatus Gracilibacteria bacterium]|nr:F0F1 ATP synthase subunit A [Candidatus Gracilibacteria bacterium]
MSETEISTTTSEVHAGPHIPTLKGEPVFGFVTTTLLSMWIFMAVLFTMVFFVNRSIRLGRFGRFRLFFQELVRFMREGFNSVLDNEDFAKRNFFIIATVAVFIIFANIFGLTLEIIGAFLPGVIHYVRPITSDLSTTLVLALFTIGLAQFYHTRTKGAWVHFRGYICNFTGPHIGAKFGNMLFGWLHIISELSRILSLSFRLFGNIFAGIILISVITFLSAEFLKFPIFGPVPFFLYEIFVALFQGFIFTLLMLVYFKESQEVHH